MRILSVPLAAALLLTTVSVTSAQTADEVIERSLKAIGGREAHEKLKSRSMTGTINISTPAGEIAGTIEILSAPPNKTRSVVKADLTALGAGPMVLDQRFDGTTGYVLDSLQGNREMTGGQLENLKNNSFPHPFMNYKAVGTAKLGGKEKVGDREAFVVELTPKSGPAIRYFIDAESYMPLKMVMRVEIPQLGQELEQTTEFHDYKEVDGTKIPFRVQSSSSIQSFTISINKVEHNVPVDEKLFVKPAA